MKRYLYPLLILCTVQSFSKFGWPISTWRMLFCLLTIIMKPGEAGRRPSPRFWLLGLRSFLRICHFSKGTQASYARPFSPSVHEIQLVHSTSRPVDTSEHCSSISSSHLRDMSIFRTHTLSFRTHGLLARYLFPHCLSKFYSLIMHFNFFISMKYPPPGNFFVVSLVIFNQTFLLNPGICWQAPFTLDGKFSYVLTCVY